MFYAIGDAILLEALFNIWCGDNYSLFAEGGEFPGLGTPRELFRASLDTIVRFHGERK